MKILEFWKRQKKKQEQQEQSEEQQIKECVYKFWQYCEKGGYRLQGYKEGVLLPQIVTFELTGLHK
jgi:hypothetical protein